LLKPLIKLILTHLDTAVDWYLERQRLAIQFVIPGTLLFVFLFWIFSGAGGTAFLLLVFLAIMESILAAGLYLIEHRYQDYIHQRHEIADAIEASLMKNDVLGEWETFLGTPLEDPELDEIRQLCQGLPHKYPPLAQGDFCGPEGDHLLEALSDHLRSGYATKFFEDFGVWRSARREAKRRRTADKAKLRAAMTGIDPETERRHQAADAVQHVPSMTGSAVIDQRDRRTVEQEAAHETKRAEPAAPAAPEYRPAEPPPASAQTKPRKRFKGMSEAAAIERAMKEGFTAHHFDQMQELLTAQLRREPSPTEVLKSLRTSRKKSRKGSPRAPRGARGRRGRQAARTAVFRPMTRRASGDFFSDGTPIKMEDRTRSRFGFVKALLVLALLGSAPFVAWRVPKPDGELQIIVGTVDHQVIDHAPDWKHQLRTPFEEIFGNRPVTLDGGQRIYVTPPDYEKCWPEPWGEMYEKGYSVQITAQAQPLLLGGFTVAKVVSAEKVSRPMAGVSDAGGARAGSAAPRWAGRPDRAQASAQSRR